MDGVVHLTVRGYDPNGNWINGFNPTYTNTINTLYYSNAYGEAQYVMFSNAVPASVELELGVLEDRPLARAESLSQIPNREFPPPGRSCRSFATRHSPFAI